MGCRINPHVLRCVRYCALCCICMLCSATSCQDDDIENSTYFYIVNGSEETMYVGFYGDNEHIVEPADVLLRTGLDGLAKISPGEKFEYRISEYLATHKRGAYHQHIVFSQSTIDEVGISTIIENGIFDARYVFSYYEMEEMNFEIVFKGKDSKDINTAGDE